CGSEARVPAKEAGGSLLVAGDQTRCVGFAADTASAPSPERSRAVSDLAAPLAGPRPHLDHRLARSLVRLLRGRRGPARRLVLRAGRVAAGRAACREAR